MQRVTIIRVIDAPLDLVFKTVAQIEEFSKAIPHIAKIEMLSDVKSGVGTRFRETRIMKGKEVSNDLEVTEYVLNDHVRLVADTHGTVWDTLFTVKTVNGMTEMTMVMDAKAHKFLPKIMNSLIMGMVKKAIEQDMDSVKAYCERETSARAKSV